MAFYYEYFWESEADSDTADFMDFPSTELEVFFKYCHRLDAAKNIALMRLICCSGDDEPLPFDITLYNQHIAYLNQVIQHFGSFDWKTEFFESVGGLDGVEDFMPGVYGFLPQDEQAYDLHWDRGTFESIATAIIWILQKCIEKNEPVIMCH
jgi:hypothetical protein